MLDPPRALRVVREVHDFGVLVSVDDYGTGFSALGYLRDLAVHGLKLDKSFIGGMRNRKGNRVIVESTVRMAHALELQVVAEGVESDCARPRGGRLRLCAGVPLQPATSGRGVRPVGNSVHRRLQGSQRAAAATGRCRRSPVSPG
jgi:predicted signal transduction protein with EAL and GGDEF domain